MQLSQFVSVLAAAFIGAVAAGPVLDARGGVPCNFYNPASEPCPAQWPVCVRFPSSCTANCAGICTKG